MSNRATDDQLAEWERRAESIGELFPFVEDLVEALKAERVRAGKAEAANYSTLHEQEIIHLHEQLATTKAQLKAVTEYHGCPAGAHMDHAVEPTAGSVSVSGVEI